MLKILRGELYRHRNTLDIDMYVSGEVFHGTATVGFTVRYWNRHYGVFQGKEEFIRIKYSELHKWTKL